MALKKKKGFNIATKTSKYKLSRNGFDFEATKQLFNQVVEFYFIVINTEPDGFLSPEARIKQQNGKPKDVRGHYEALTIGGRAKYPFPFDVPTYLRRAAFEKAVGAYSSWRTNYQRWQNRPKRHQHHKPPVQPRKFNFNPTYYAGMYKDLIGNEIVLKLLVNNACQWVKFTFKGRSNASIKGWGFQSPTIQIKGGEAYISFTIQRYVPATGGIKNQIVQDAVRVLGIDLDLDNHAAILSVLELKDSQGREVARRFIRTPNGVNLRKRALGKIAQKMNKTGIIHKGFCFKKWEKIRNSEKDMGSRVARQIVNFARQYHCRIISFEHLGNLRPNKGKYSKRSNQKRSYWLKGKIYQNVKITAYNDYGILTTRVNPRNTSRLSPWGEPLARKNHIPTDTEAFLSDYESGATWIKSVNGYTAHSGLNAARNVAMKLINRYYPELQLSRDITQIKATNSKAGGV
ncbi:MAG: hypothetical protein QNJ51_20225 [Calothrix sp. MO_167.B12]|nr:hypothetical protein [Calothrix sp. MO_167.B12]